MALAAEEYADLIDSMGLAGTAAANLSDILDRLTASQRAESAMATIAASTGSTVSQVRSAMTAATNAAAAAEDKLTAAHKANEAAERAAAAASKAQVSEVATAQEKSDKARIGLSGVLEGVVGKATGGLKKLGDAGLLSGEQVAGMTDKISAGAAALGPYAAAAEVAVKVITYLGEKLYDLGAAAVNLTQEKDALRATFDAFTGGGGQALLDGIEAMSSKLPYTADQLNTWAQRLTQAGIQGEVLAARLQAVSAAGALVKGGAEGAESLFTRLAMMADAGEKVTLNRRFQAQLLAAGVTVKDLAAQLGVPADKLSKMALSAEQVANAVQASLVGKAGAALTIMGDSWASISAKLKEGWEDAFEDLGSIVGPFMSELRGLASEFYAGSIASGTLKDVVKAVLTPAFEVATRVVRGMHIAVLEIEIAYLKASIALRPFTEALGKIGVSGGIVAVAMYLIKGTAIVLTVVFGLLAVATTLAFLPFIVAGLAVYGLYRLISYLVDIIGGAIEHFDNLKAKVSEVGTSVFASIGAWGGQAVEAAENFVVGLVDGIVTGQIKFFDAVKNMAKGGVQAFLSAMHIQSPSKIMWEHGEKNIAGAVAGGVDAGAPQVDRAMSDMAVSGTGSVPRDGRRGARRGDRVFAPSFTNCTFGGDMTQDKLDDWLDAWWERRAAEGPDMEPA